MDPQSMARARNHLQNRAAADAGFRQRLLADPRAAVESEFGRVLPDEIELAVLEETATKLYLLLTPPPPDRNSKVTLREITGETVRTVCALAVKEDQRNFVASNAISISEAHFSPKAWFRAIYADVTPVGFVMLLDDPEKPAYYVWRYMIAGEYQGLGFGRRALEQVIAYVRTRPDATELTLSYVPGEGSPREFYARLGFEDTGIVHAGEKEMKLAL